MIQETLDLIKEKTGLSLVLCDHFAGVQKCFSGEYFNVVLPDKICESNDYIELKRFSKKYGLVRVEPNGVRRVAIFRIA
jgi:hypothetical protein